MPHIDEGILHAYLDGALDALSDAGELPDGMTGADVLAHLQACPDCAARLETERAVREGAGAIMRDAAPDTIDVPGLPAAPPSRRRPWVPLSWAASLLLAAGAGWWSSEILRSPEFADIGPARGASGSAARPPAVMSESTATEARDVGEVPAPTRPSPAEGTTRGRSAAQSDVSEEQPSASADAADRRQSLRRERRTEGAASAGNAAAPPAAPPPPLSAVAETREPVATRGSPPPPAPAARSFVPTDTSAPLRNALAQRVVVTGDGASMLDSALAREREGTLQFESVPRADRGTRGAGAWVVRDAAITELGIAESAGYRLVRAHQRLASGDPVVVLTWLPQAPPAVTGLEMSKAAEPQAAAEDAALAFTVAPGYPRLLVDGRRELRLGAADAPLWLVIRADLPAERLLELMGRLDRLPR